MEEQESARADQYAVIHQGFVFGPDGNVGGGNLVCLDLSTGAKRWEEKSSKAAR
jgi:hypothetical protein